MAFRGRRGTAISTNRIAAPPHQFLVVPHAAHASDFVPSRSSRRLPERPEAVVAHDRSCAGTALRAARTVAFACDAPLLLLLCPGEDASPVRLALQGPGAASRGVQQVRLHDASNAAIASAARQYVARLLVCSAEDLRGDARGLEALLSRLRCPVVVAH